MEKVLSIDLGVRGFSDGILRDIVHAYRELADGGLLTIRSRREDLRPELASWADIVGATIVSESRLGGSAELVLRKGNANYQEEPERPIGSRIWLYTNFDCNLACDYCCVRSSPRTPRNELEPEIVAQIAREARELSVDSFFLTGGEPFLLPSIVDNVLSCAAVAPVTLLTNAMLFQGARLERLRAMPRQAVTLQVSIDSPGPALHDLHRGKGAWERAMRGVRTAREEGFRVRLAATVGTDAEEAAITAFLDREGIAQDDRVVRRIALRGFASDGIPLAVQDLVPEPTITAKGVYWHPVGATDDDFLVTSDIFPLRAAIEAVRMRAIELQGFHDRVASVFHCA